MGHHVEEEKSRLYRDTPFEEERQALDSAWQNDGVDNVDHAVGAFDIRLDDVRRAIELHATSGADLHARALNSRGFFSVQLDNVCSQDLTSHNVVGEDCGQLGNVV